MAASRRTGNPSQPGLAWTPYSLAGRETMIFDSVSAVRSHDDDRLLSLSPCAELPNVWPPGRIGQRRRATGAGSCPMPQMCPSVRITMTPSEMAGVAMITSPMECFASSTYSRPACATTTSPSSFAM